ncbi:hypothetical protein QOZ80_5BG0433980 [Eleusine coracana subsp. coracana]|nr:hypothetical protein QOZ80_5BG0433980 [Eleusine coracana subsp. coracana]
MFASLRACLDVSAMDSAPNIRTMACCSLFSHHGPSLVASLMQNKELCLNRKHLIIGNIPGIFVGDAFLFPEEMFVVGLHESFQGGFCFSRTSNGSEPACLITIATSVVISADYEDNAGDDGDLLIYLGQGGPDLSHKKQATHQVLEDGRLALKNNIDYGIEVRVIRGIKLNPNDNVIYFYDGLYIVKTYDVPCEGDELGQSGLNRYKFKLQRLPGQGPMGSMMYRHANLLRKCMLNLPPGKQVFDLSMGQEGLPVGFHNHVDDSLYPLKFRYLPKPEYPERTPFFYPGLGSCNCTGNCSVAAGNGCFCVSLNGGELPYNNSGVLLHGKHMVFECGPQCRCPPTCPNRVSQRGLTRRLQVFRSKVIEGWEVRSLDLIPAGTFVCEITGKVMSLSKSQQQQYMNKMATKNLTVTDPILMFPEKLPHWWMEWGNNITQVIPGYKPPANLFEQVAPDLSSFVIDMTKSRNVGCYLSNSKTPNLFAQFVLFDHHVTSMPHVMIFALQDILPMTELTLDYGY